MVNRESTLRGAVIAWVLAGLAGPLPALAQTQEPKAEQPAEQPATARDKPAPQPPRRDRGTRKSDSAGEERPRPDVPVSFPVDI